MHLVIILAVRAEVVQTPKAEIYSLLLAVQQGCQSHRTAKWDRLSLTIKRVKQSSLCIYRSTDLSK